MSVRRSEKPKASGKADVDRLSAVLSAGAGLAPAFAPRVAPSVARPREADVGMPMTLSLKQMKMMPVERVEMTVKKALMQNRGLTPAEKIMRNTAILMLNNVMTGDSRMKGCDIAEATAVFKELMAGVSTSPTLRGPRVEELDFGMTWEEEQAENRRIVGWNTGGALAFMAFLANVYMEFNPSESSGREPAFKNVFSQGSIIIYAMAIAFGYGAATDDRR